MPVTQIDEPHGIIFEYSGILSINDLSSSVLALGDDPNFIHVRYIIIDYSKVIGDNMSLNNVEDIAAQVIGGSYRNTNFIMSIVAPTDRIKALTNYFKELTENICISIFDNIIDARKWVDEELQTIKLKKHLM